MTSLNYTPIKDLIEKLKSSSVGLPKESEPFAPSETLTPQEYSEIQEVVEHVPDEEVQTHVEVRKDNIELSADLTEAGLQQVSSTQFPSYQNIKLPISDDKIVSGMKAPIHTSLRWLALFATYLLWQAHVKLKVVHGKVVRVLAKKA